MNALNTQNYVCRLICAVTLWNFWISNRRDLIDFFRLNIFKYKIIGYDAETESYAFLWHVDIDDNKIFVYFHSKQ